MKTARKYNAVKEYNNIGTGEYADIIKRTAAILMADDYDVEYTESSIKVFLNIYGPSWLKTSLNKEVETDISTSFRMACSK